MNERYIKSNCGRYLHSDEVFRKEKNWNINLPNEREFKTGECVVTDKDDTAYSIDELVTLLNEFQKENEELKQILWDTVSKTDVKIMEGKGFYSITLTIDGKMYGKIQEILRVNPYD